MPEPSDRERYARGLDDYHDPTAGVGGAPPARSALTLRLWLAGFGLVFCAVGAVMAAWAGLGVLAVILGVFAVVAAVDLVWVAHRKRRGEPG
jgi:fatty acid desaturase